MLNVALFFKKDSWRLFLANPLNIKTSTFKNASLQMFYMHLCKPKKSIGALHDFQSNAPTPVDKK
jgi:hypothetical protein